MRTATLATLLLLAACSDSGREPADSPDAGPEPICAGINQTSCDDDPPAAGPGAEPAGVQDLLCGCRCERDGEDVVSASVECRGDLDALQRDIRGAWTAWIEDAAGTQCSEARPCTCACSCVEAPTGAGNVACS